MARPARRDAVCRRGRASAYAASGKPRASERDAYAAMFTKAPPARAVRAALERVGGGLWRLADHRRQRRARLEHRDQPHRSAPRSAPTIASRRTRIAGFALAGGGTSFSVANGGSGRSDLFQAGAFVRHTVGPAYISGALAYGWQDITTDRTVTDRRHRSAARASSTPTPCPAASRAAIASSRRGSAASASRPMPPASSPPSICRPMPNRRSSGANTFALAYGAKSVTDTAQRTRPAHRQILCDAERRS